MPIFKTKNQDFFKKWTPKMAYILGFFAADGTMIENKRGAHFIEIQITDKKLLEEIRDVLGSNHKITIRERWKENKNWKTSYRLQIGSNTMFNDLLRLGLTPRKSKTIRLPLVPKRYFSHFTRGLFDGDGNVTVSNYIRANRNNKRNLTILSGFTSGSEHFLKELHIKLKEITNILGGTFYYNKGYRLCFSVKDSFNLYNFMYGDVNKQLFLPRKKKIFENYFKID